MMRSQRLYLPLLFCCASLGSGAPALAGETTVLLADGVPVSNVDLKPGPRPDQLVLERTGAEPVTAPVQDLLSVDFGKSPGRPFPPTARLVNGDQLYGKLTFPTPRQVRIAAGWGSLTVPLDWCAALRLDEKAELPEPGTQDTLVMANDRVQGQVQGIAGGKVTIAVGGTPIPVDLARVRAISLAARPEAARAAPAGANAAVRITVDLGGGERISGQWVELTPELLKIRLDWGAALEVPVASISRLDVRNGRLVYLSDLTPGEVRLTPYIGGEAPGSLVGFQKDRSVAGRPIRMRGRAFSRGVGTRSRSDLTYSLNGAFKEFAATAGVDDAVGGQGSVVFRVYGDEKLLFESPVVRGGDAPVEIKVDVSKVVLLRLEVDYGGDSDAADHANWANARLLRP